MEEPSVSEEKKEGGGESWFSSDICMRYAPVLLIVALIVVISTVVCYKDGFASPDGVVARRSQRQIRGDADFDKTFNLKELEKSVALINRKSGAYK